MSTTEEMKLEAGKRLTLIRLAMGYKTSSAFAADYSVGIDAMSAYENGIRTIPWTLLRELHDREKVSSDFIIHGELAGMPHRLVVKMKEIEQTPGWDIPTSGPKSRGRKKQNL